MKVKMPMRMAGPVRQALAATRDLLHFSMLALGEAPEGGLLAVMSFGEAARPGQADPAMSAGAYP